MQEAGNTVDSTHSPFIFDEKAAVAAASKPKKLPGEAIVRVKGQSAKKTALNADQDAWEANRLLTRCEVRGARARHPARQSMHASLPQFMNAIRTRMHAPNCRVLCCGVMCWCVLWVWWMPGGCLVPGCATLCPRLCRAGRADL